MGILLNAYQLKKSFSFRPLFEGLTFSIESSERIGLIGPNGAGKSTLLRILAGKENVDKGDLSISRGLCIGYLPQVPLFQTTEETVLKSILGKSELSLSGQEELLIAHELISKLSLPSPETLISSLSGGWKKKVALARELAKCPDLLLLDEPTNHLDVESILWLEDLLKSARFSTLTITHDRLFLQRIANRIIELDRRNPGGLLQIKGDYLTYLKLKEEKISAQEQEEIKLKNTLRRESEWLSRGPKARSTKQQARIERANDLEKKVEELGYRNQVQKVRIDFQGAEKNPKRLIDAKGICKSYGQNIIIPPLNLLITPKSRLGLLGANGSGKTTLLKILIGEERPDAGHIFMSEQIQVAWFEQNRECLDPDLTVLKTISPDGDYVDYRGSKVHAFGYLSRFLFTKEQMDMPVGRLSGGEQSRLLIAKLMLKKANILVLDEPTNDLDISTLDILQEVLADFPGAILLVSHDRYFLDQVASQILVFDDVSSEKKQIHLFSGLDQWETWYQNTRRATPSSLQSLTQDEDSHKQQSKQKKIKLTFNEQRELSNMESTILVTEEKLATLEQASSNPENAKNILLLNEISNQMATTQKEIDRLYARWVELTEKKT